VRLVPLGRRVSMLQGPPSHPSVQPPRPTAGINAAFVLAALQQQGYLSQELAATIDTLSTSVIPLSYEAALGTLREAFAQLPCWDSCPQCRNLVAQFKMEVLAHHQAGHPTTQQTPTEPVA